MLPGGKPVFRDERVRVSVEGDQTHIAVTANSLEELRCLLEHQIKRFDLTEEDLGSADGSVS